MIWKFLVFLVVAGLLAMSASDFVWGQEMEAEPEAEAEEEAEEEGEEEEYDLTAADHRTQVLSVLVMILLFVLLQ